MNFSGNITQIVIILFIALLVFGPKKMMEYAYQAGKWIAKLRVMYEQTMQQVQAEMEQAGVGEAAQLLNRRVDIASEAEKFLNAPRPADTTNTENTTNTANTADTAPAVTEVAAPVAVLTEVPAAAPAAPVIPPTPAAAETTPAESSQEQGRYNAWLPD